MKKKYLSALLAFSMVLTTVMPGQTFAADSGKTSVAEVKSTQPEKKDVVILDEDFEDGTVSVDFKAGGADTAVTLEVTDAPGDKGGKAYKVQSPNSYIYAAYEDWSEMANYTFECKLYVDSWMSPGTPWDCVAPAFLLQGDGQSNPARAELKYRKASKDLAYFTGVGGDEDVKAAPNFEQKWHHYKVVTEGNTFKAYIDDMETPAFSRTDARCSAGTIGFDGLSAVYYIDDLKVTRQTSKAPSANVESGEYESAFNVELTAEQGDSIYYTVDGSDPTVKGILYDGPIRITGDMTLKAAAVANGKCYSDIVTYEYKVNEVACPVFSPAGGRYKDSVKITLDCETPNAEIYYTLDGTEPDTDSTRYEEPFTLSETTVVKAIAATQSGIKSGTVTREYIITDDLVEKRFYVAPAPEGNDDNDGTKAHPFETIERAKEEVRKYNKDMKGDIEVLVKEGRYYLDEAIRFDEKDSGTNERQIIYKSVDGIGKAEIIGGREVTGWEAATADDVAMGLDESLVGKVYKAELGADKFDFNALYVEGVDSGFGNDKAIMARTPNYEHDERFATQRGGYLFSAGGGVSDLVYRNGDLTQAQIDGMAAAQERGEKELAQIYVWDGGDWDWFTSTLPVNTIDVNARRLAAVTENPDDHSVYPVRTKYGIGGGARYYLQGNLAFLDVPGEYFYHKPSGTVYYYPKDGVKMEDLTVIAPKTQELFRFEGNDKPSLEDWANEPNPDKQVSNITLDGFDMRDTEYTDFFSSGWNSGDAWGCGYFAPEAKYSTQPSNDETTDRPEFKVGAVTMINTNHLTVQNCEIHNTGLWGIMLSRDNQYNTVKNCDIGYNGFGAINADGGYPGVGKYSKYNTYDNLRLHDSGQNIGHAGTVTIMNSGYSTFSHLDIRNTPRRALTMLGSWNRKAEDNKYNPLTDLYAVGNHFEYINIDGGEQDSGEDSTIFFAMMIPTGTGRIPAERRNYMNQIIVDHTGAAPSMHDKNTAHGMEFAMGVNGMTVSNVKGVNSQSNALAIYYRDGDMGWDIENTNSNYYDENIFDDPEYFDDSKMEYDKIGTREDFPFEPEWTYDAEKTPENLYFGDDFESAKVSLRKWTVENGKPRINAANMAEGPYNGKYSVELKGGNAGNPAVLSRKFNQNLNKIVEVKYFDKRQDYAGSDKYGGRPNMTVRADDGEHVIAIGANGWENTERYFYMNGDEKVWTDVQRTYGWHEFKFDYTSGTDVKLSIDGTLVATLPAESFNYVAMNDYSGNERQACFDQFWIYGGADAEEPGDAGVIKPPANAEEGMFEEDFEGEETTVWTKGGNKKITGTVVTDPDNADNKLMKIESVDGVLYYNTPENWSNYVFEYRMRLDNWTGTYPWTYMAPTFYATPSDRPAMPRYSFKYGRYTNQFALFNGAANGDIISRDVPEGFDAGQWHEFKVVLNDGTVSVYMDGGQEPVFQHKDTSNSGGTIGFEGSGANFYVDDIRVTRQDTAAPVADKESGTYEGTQEVVLSVADTTADIFYTLDGSDPMTNGLYYYGDEPVVIEKTSTLKAVAIGKGKCYSDVVEYQYVLAGEPKDVEFTITVDGKSETHKYNDAVTIEAAEKEGYTFAGWKVGGEIVSYDAEYKFYVSKDMMFEATYAQDTVKEIAKAMLTNVFVEKREDRKSNVKFVGELALPEGYKVLEAGLVWSSKDNTELVIGEGLKPTYISKISDTNQFSVTIKGMPADRFIRGVIFAKVADPDGNETYIYSTEEKVYAAK